MRPGLPTGKAPKLVPALVSPGLARPARSAPFTYCRVMLQLAEAIVVTRCISYSVQENGSKPFFATGFNS